MALKCTVEDLREIEIVKNRAVIYARYSSEKQKEASIEQQVNACMEYITRKGYSLIRVYSDSAKSASHNVEKRSDFLKLIEDAESGEFDVVVSYALDRISREEHGGFYGYENALNRNGVRIEYATQVFDDGYGGEISKAVHVTMASEYVAQLRKNVVRGMRDNVENGRFNGGSSVPIGIKIVGEGKKNKRYAVDEAVSPYIKQAFEMYVSGQTTGDIMEFLNDNGVRTSRGKKVSRDTVNRMLANPIYIGRRVSKFNNKVEHKVYTVDGVCEPIISEELWERTQVSRQKRLNRGMTEAKRKKYILRGKLFCGLCGTEMVADCGRSSTGEKYYYYTCGHRKQARGGERCRKQPIPKELLENCVIEIITNRLWDQAMIDEYACAAREAAKKREEDPQIVRLRAEIKSHAEKKKRAMQCYLDTADTEWYDMSKDEARLLKECEAELATRIRQDHAPKNADEFLAEIRQLRSAWDEMLKTDAGRERIVQTYVERIDIFDPAPDDPGKCRLDLLIRTDTDAEASEHVQAEVECAVRVSEKMGHQQQFAQSGGLFIFYKNPERQKPESQNPEDRRAHLKRMKKLITYIKKDPMLPVALLAAVLSLLITPPSKALLSAIDWRTLGTLFMMLTVLEGFKQENVFRPLLRLTGRIGTMAGLSLFLVFGVFFSSMFVTNDVSLIVFVPITILLFRAAKQEAYILPVISMENIAAVRGSLLTPFGSPQNLFIYGQSGVSAWHFVCYMFPIWILSGGLLVCFVLFLYRKKLKLSTNLHRTEIAGVWERSRRTQRIVYLCLFVLVLGVIVSRTRFWYVAVAVVAAAVLLTDRTILLKTDYVLLVTFLCFFVFSSSVAANETVAAFLQKAMDGREYAGSILLSQVISNVPAAIVLYPFSKNVGALLYGLDSAGLVSLIGSLASVINYRIYVREYPGSGWKFIKTFTLVSLAFFAFVVLPGYLISRGGM